MGGYQAIYFVEDPTASAPGAESQAPINGYYRAGSDFGKDGQAVGW